MCGTEQQLIVQSKIKWQVASSKAACHFQKCFSLPWQEKVLTTLLSKPFRSCQMCYQTSQEEKLLISCRLKFRIHLVISKKHDVCSNTLLVATTASGSLSLLFHSSTCYSSSGVIAILYVYLPLYFLWTSSPCLPSSFLEKKTKQNKTFN